LKFLLEAVYIYCNVGAKKCHLKLLVN